MHTSISFNKLKSGKGLSTFLCALLAACCMMAAALAAPGDLDYEFNSLTTIENPVAAVLLDGSVLVPGQSGPPGSSSCHLQRFVEGTLDESFVQTVANSGFRGIHVLDSGKILVYGNFSIIGGVTRAGLARLNADGSFDPTFTPSFHTVASPGVQQIVVLEDGKILVGGAFDQVNGLPYAGLVRLFEDGSVDTGFTPPAFSSLRISNVVLQSDGKLLVAGDFTSVNSLPRDGLVRLNLDGSVDGAFESAFPLSASSDNASIVEQKDGNILVGHPSSINGLDILVNVPAGERRIYRTVGRLLGTTGQVDSAFELISDLWTYGIALQCDGKILLSGAGARYLNGVYDNGAALEYPLFRINPDGSVDDTFAVSSSGNFAGGIMQTSDGTVFASSYFNTYEYNGQSVSRSLIKVENSEAVSALRTTAHNRLEWIRGGAAPEVNSVTFELSPDGVFWIPLGGGTRTENGWAVELAEDLSFPEDCILRARSRVYGGWQNRCSYPIEALLRRGQFESSDRIVDDRFYENLPAIIKNNRGSGISAVQADGKILLVGNFGGSVCKVLRIFPNGSHDAAFSVVLDNGETIFAIAALPDGKIILGGEFSSIQGQPRKSLARLNANGTLDTTFDDPDITYGSGSGIVKTLVVQPDGAILAGGLLDSAQGMSHASVVRILADGSVDGTFSTGGYTTADVECVVLQPNGKILVGCNQWDAWDGSSVQTTTGLVRLNADGSQDYSFNADIEGGMAEGTNTSTFYGGEVRTLALLKDGKILVAGDFLRAGGGSRPKIALLASNGSLIPGFNFGGKFLTESDAMGNPAENQFSVSTIAVQTDGKFILGGFFTYTSQPDEYGWTEFQDSCETLRCTASGKLDRTFNSFAQGADYLYGGIRDCWGNLILLRSGHLLDGTPRIYLNQRGEESLTVESLTRVVWSRTGTNHETSNVTFDHSSDRTTWTPMGSASRINGGWEWTGAPLPVSGWIRARASIVQPNSSSVLQKIVAYPATTMVVQGNGQSIPDKASVPSAANHTVFPYPSPSSSSRTFRITNTGADNLEVTGIQIEGVWSSKFSLSGISFPHTVSPGDFKDFTISFTPAGVQSCSATVVIESNAAPDPHTFGILGAVESAKIEVYSGNGKITDGSTSYSTLNGTDLGEVRRYPSGRDQMYTILNTGNQILNITSFTISGPHASDFYVYWPGAFVLNPGEQRPVYVGFQPSAAGIRSATFTIQSDHPQMGAFDFSVRGYGVSPQMRVVGNGIVIGNGDNTPDLADHTAFGNSFVGKSSTRSFFVKNIGKAETLDIDNVVVSGAAASDFSVSWTAASLRLASRGPDVSQKDLVVTFAPTAPGVRKASIILSSNDPDVPSYTFDVEGYANLKKLEVWGNNVQIASGDTTPTTDDWSDFWWTPAGTNLSRTFTVKNAGNWPVTIYQALLSGPGASTFAVTTVAETAFTWPVTLNAGQSVLMKVTFTPPSTGEYLATLSLPSDDPVNPSYHFDIKAGCTAAVLELFHGTTSLPSGGGLDFGPAPGPPGTVSRTFTIKNTGSTPLGIAEIKQRFGHMGAFTLGGITLPASVAPNATTTFTITYQGFNYDTTHNGYFLIKSNDVNGEFYALTVSAEGLPEINVQGRGITIGSGDTTPSAPDETDVGWAMSNNEQIQVTYRIQNLGTRMLGVSNINLSGANAGDFSLLTATSYAIGPGAYGFWDIKIAFNPTVPGPRTATVNITSNDADEGSYSFAIQGTGGLPGALDQSYVPPAFNGAVNTAVELPDGKVIVGGLFTTTAGSYNRLARLNADGQLDTTFFASLDNEVLAVHVLPDDRLIVSGEFTNVNGTSRSFIARLSKNGMLDTSYVPTPNGFVYAMALQRDGKMVIAGAFTSIGGVTRNRIARLNSDGSLDTTFNPNAGGNVYTLAIQENDKILAGGTFTTLGGVTQNRIVRLNADGSRDTGFTASATGTSAAVNTIAIQPDDKILIGGNFTSVNSVARARLTRLNADGSLDTSFAAYGSGAYGINNNQVFSLALQRDGYILGGGSFKSYATPELSYLYLVGLDAMGYPAGTIYPDGSPYAMRRLNGHVYSTSLMKDGSILLGGNFTTYGTAASGGVITRNRVAKLRNNLPVEELFRVYGGSGKPGYLWERNETCPETQMVWFDVSEDGGTTWTSLGQGTRVPGNLHLWRIQDLTLPVHGKIRGRAFIRTGKYNGSAGMVEILSNF